MRKEALIRKVYRPCRPSEVFVCYAVKDSRPSGTCVFRVTGYQREGLFDLGLAASGACLQAGIGVYASGADPEDRATQACDPSAVAGGYTAGRGPGSPWAFSFPAGSPYAINASFGEEPEKTRLVEAMPRSG